MSKATIKSEFRDWGFGRRRVWRFSVPRTTGFPGTVTGLQLTWAEALAAVCGVLKGRAS